MATSNSQATEALRACHRQTRRSSIRSPSSTRAIRSRTRSCSSSEVGQCLYDGRSGFRRSLEKAKRRRGSFSQSRLWLWFTVLFANFAEAMAEGRGKAQADALRGSRKDTKAKKINGERRDSRSSLRPISAKVDVVRIEGGRRYSRATARLSRASPRSTKLRSRARARP